jgi:hypothetical protein
MSRTKKGKKPLGYDYWSRRPGSGRGFGKLARKITVRKERMQESQLLEKFKKDLTEGREEYGVGISNREEEIIDEIERGWYDTED